MKISKQVMAVVKDLIDLIGADEVQEVEIERKFFGRGRIRVVRANGQVPIVQTLGRAGPCRSTRAAGRRRCGKRRREPVPHLAVADGGDVLPIAKPGRTALCHRRRRGDARADLVHHRSHENHE